MATLVVDSQTFVSLASEGCFNVCEEYQITVTAICADGTTTSVELPSIFADFEDGSPCLSCSEEDDESVDGDGSNDSSNEDDGLLSGSGSSSASADGVDTAVESEIGGGDGDQEQEGTVNAEVQSEIGDDNDDDNDDQEKQRRKGGSVHYQNQGWNWFWKSSLPHHFLEICSSGNDSIPTWTGFLYM